ncbi:MAG: MFS transporter, partial [Acidobacteriota bacterium]|nr:MFS transporter [Acidobacteriota bacterium]
GMCSAFSTIFFVRLILGIGESVAYPSYSKILAGHFREDQRGVANSLVDVGSKTGPAIGVLIGGLFMAEYGWRVFFFTVGTASLLWLIPWSIWAPKDRALLPREAGEVPTIRQIVSKRAAWGTFFGLLCSNYVWYFMVTWLPSYFTMERHYSQREMAIFGSVPFWGVAAASLTGGWLSDRWIARGGSPNRVRKTFIGTGLMMCTLMLPAAMVQDQKLSMVLLTIACVSYGFFSSNLWAVTQTLAGPWAAGKWTGLQNCIGNIPGIVAPGFTGWVVKETGQFYYAFVAATFFLVAGTFFFLWMVPKVEPVDWSKDKRV